MANIKPCPFCGGSARVYDISQCFVICKSCGAQGPPVTEFVDMTAAEKAIELWNERKTHA